MKNKRIKKKRRRRSNKRHIFNNLIIIVTIAFILNSIINTDLYLKNSEKLVVNKKDDTSKEPLEGGILTKDEINKGEKVDTDTEKDIEEDLVSDNKTKEDILDNSGYLSLSNDINADDAKTIEQSLNNWDYRREDGKKVAYLTFDDGPSEYVTPEILDILSKNNVKATFFALGSMIENSENAKETLKRMVKEGHAIANHGYCHRYEILYPNRVVDSKVFIDDMKKSEAVMKSVLGQDFSTRVIRFPGGHSSWNTDAVDIALEKEGYVYIDWNSLNGDAEGHNVPKEKLINRLKTTVADIYGNNDILVVLMHDVDAKETTVEALQDIINYLRALGYEFRTLK